MPKTTKRTGEGKRKLLKEQGRKTVPKGNGCGNVKLTHLE